MRFRGLSDFAFVYIAFVYIAFVYEYFILNYKYNVLQ